MIYDVVVTVKTKEKAEKDESTQRTFSLRVVADNAAQAKLEATNELRRRGVADVPRSGFSIRTAR